MAGQVERRRAGSFASAKHLVYAEATMDWENKHFNQETVLHAPPAAVAEAARRFTLQSLPDWTVEPTADGFDASGESGMHHAVAHVRWSPVSDGTKVAVELLVKRANGFGQYMLVDIGNYYDRLISKWLWGIWKQVGEAHTDPGGHAPIAPHGTTAPNATPGARVVVMDAFGRAYLGVVHQVTAQGVLVAYDEGSERWVPATAAHVIEPREDQK